MDIVYAKPDAFVIRTCFEHRHELSMAAGRFNRNHIGIEFADDIHKIMEFAIAHMCMNLGTRCDGRGR